MGEIVSIPTADGSYNAYTAYPLARQGPGLLVLPEIYNSNDHIRSVADHFAAEGFTALAPAYQLMVAPSGVNTSATSPLPSTRRCVTQMIRR